MIPINKENTDNALAFLVLIHKRITTGAEVSLNKLINKNRYPQYASNVLKNEKILVKSGAGRNTVWGWNTIAPNDKMAAEFLSRLNKYKPSRREPKELPPKEKRVLLATNASQPAPQAVAEKDCEETAIALLKSLGYRVLKPTFIEV